MVLVVGFGCAMHLDFSAMSLVFCCFEFVILALWLGVAVIWLLFDLLVYCCLLWWFVWVLVCGC